jgi:methylglyoxal reductase
MKYQTFAGSAIPVSRISFGAMGLNGAFGKYDEAYLIRSILHCLEKGVNFIDTARAYGHSEMIVGKALKEWSGAKPFIASKVESRSSLGWGTSVPIQDAYPKGSIRTSVEASLKQLDVESLDLIQMHQYWSQWDDAEEWIDELQQLKQEGKVRFIGVSLPDHRHDMAISLVRSGKIDSIQTIFNIFDPIALDNLIPICQQHNVAVIARCILDEGGLSGFLKEDTTFEEGDFRKPYFDSLSRNIYMERVDSLRQFIPEHAKSLVHLAIKFAIHHPGITTALTSMNIPEYADENIAALDESALPEDIFINLSRKHRWVRNFYEKHYW